MAPVSPVSIIGGARIFDNVINNQLERKKLLDQRASIPVSHKQEVPNHLTATRDPTFEDDWYDGWREGSQWENVSNGNLWVCTEANQTLTQWTLSVLKSAENNSNYLKLTNLEVNKISQVGEFGIFKVNLGSTKIVRVEDIYFKDYGRLMNGFTLDEDSNSVYLKSKMNLDLYKASIRIYKGDK